MHCTRSYDKVHIEYCWERGRIVHRELELVENCVFPEQKHSNKSKEESEKKMGITR